MNIEKDFKLFALDKGISSTKVDGFYKYNIKNGYITPYVLEERNLNVSSLDIYSRLLMDRILFLNTEITILTEGGWFAPPPSVFLCL